MAIRAGGCLCPQPTSSQETGKVIFAEAHADFRVRPEPEEALEVLSTSALNSLRIQQNATW